jgi:predicted nucleic acid-binding protein
VWLGFHLLPPNHQDYERIKRIANELPQKYRVLNLDTRAAAIWGELTAQAEGPLPLRDSLIAAIVRSRGQRIVTRDTAPFERMGCKVIAPWK